MLAGALGLVPAQAQTSGQPIRIGSTLALTGPLAATGIVHKIVGEIYVEQLNKGSGLLGRPVEWVLLDDQSKPDLARTLYERLITVDKVDLLLGPYATGAILSAMAVAERHDKMLVHHTFGIPKMAKYERQFPAWHMGPLPDQTVPNLVLSALAASDNPPKTVAIVTSKFPSVHFIGVGAREVAKKRNLQEVLYLEFEFGSRDFGADRGARARGESRPAVRRRHRPRRQPAAGGAEEDRLHAQEPLLPLPGAGPARRLAGREERAVDHGVRGPAPLHRNPKAAAFAKLFRERATAANLPYAAADVQAGSSYTAWQIIETAVTQTKSLDDKVLAQWLNKNQVDTITGRLRFNETGNYGDDLSKLKQVQDGKWVVVWPKEAATPGAKLITR